MLRGSESLETSQSEMERIAYVRGSNQSGGLESIHGSRSGNKDIANSRWEKYLPN
jgi:hypothetical protein